MVLVAAMHQHESVSSFPFPTYPTPEVVTEPWAELPGSHGKSLLAVSFTCDNVYVSLLLSQFVPSPASHTVLTSLVSISASPLLPCK